MKKILFVLFASLLVLSACGNQGEKESKEKPSNSTVEKKKEKKEEKSTEEKESNNTNEASTEKTQMSNTNEGQASVDKNQQAGGVNTQKQDQQAQSGQQTENNISTNKDMPVAHDGGQNGYGYGDYLAAKEATEQGKAQNGGKLEGVGGSWPVQDGQSFESWRQEQVNWQNMVDSTSQPAK